MKNFFEIYIVFGDLANAIMNDFVNANISLFYLKPRMPAANRSGSSVMALVIKMSPALVPVPPNFED